MPDIMVGAIIGFSATILAFMIFEHAFYFWIKRFILRIPNAPAAQQAPISWPELVNKLEHYY